MPCCSLVLTGAHSNRDTNETQAKCWATFRILVRAPALGYAQPNCELSSYATGSSVDLLKRAVGSRQHNMNGMGMRAASAAWEPTGVCPERPRDRQACVHALVQDSLRGVGDASMLPTCVSFAGSTFLLQHPGRGSTTLNNRTPTQVSSTPYVNHRTNFFKEKYEDFS